MRVDVDWDKKGFVDLGRALRHAKRDLDTNLFGDLNRGLNRTKALAARSVAREAEKSLPGDLGDWAARVLQGKGGTKAKAIFGGRNWGVTIMMAGPKSARPKPSGKGHRKAGRRLKSGKISKTAKRHKPRTFGKEVDLNAMNRGRIMHPVYGRVPRGGMRLQMVRGAGFFARGMKPVEEELSRQIKETLNDVIDKLGDAAK